jgi:TPR repeat protein
MRLPLTGILIACLALAGCAGAAMEGANIAKDEVVYENNIEAARAGDAEAQYRVGDALCCSLGDRKGFYDTRAATDWLCRAAAQGHAPASLKLGRIYSGHVVEGVRVMRRVAERVSGRPENLPVSYAWLKVAAGQGSLDAEADAQTVWSDMAEAEQARAQTLMSSGQPLPCRWDEVFPG